MTINEQPREAYDAQRVQQLAIKRLAQTAAGRAVQRRTTASRDTRNGGSK